MIQSRNKNGLQSTSGSILLMIVVISSFMLIAFSTLSTRIRTELKNRLEAEKIVPQIQDEVDRVRLTKDVFSDSRVSTSDMLITSKKRGGILPVYSGVPASVNWSGTGKIQLNLFTANAEICYSTGTAINTCTSTGITLESTGGTGAIIITTPGGFAQLDSEGTSSGILLGIPVYFEIFMPVGNISLPIAQLKTYY